MSVLIHIICSVHAEVFLRNSIRCIYTCVTSQNTKMTRSARFTKLNLKYHYRILFIFYHTMVNIDVLLCRDYMQANYFLLNGGITCLLGMDRKHGSGVYVVPSVRGSNRNVSRRVIAAGCCGTTQECRWALSVGEIVAQIFRRLWGAWGDQHALCRRFQMTQCHTSGQYMDGQWDLPFLFSLCLQKNCHHESFR